MNIVFCIGLLLCNTPKELIHSDSMESIESIQSDEDINMYEIKYTDDIITNISILDKNYDVLYQYNCKDLFPFYTDLFYDKFYDHYNTFFEFDYTIKRVLFVYGERKRFQDVLLLEKLKQINCVFDKIIFDDNFIYENGEKTSLNDTPLCVEDYYFITNLLLI